MVKGIQALSGAVLMLMMLLTAADVAFRYIFNAPIAGSLELVEYMMAVLIPFSIAFCAYKRAHVAVEFVVARLPEAVRRVLRTAVLALSFPFLLCIAWQSFAYALEIRQCDLTSPVLLIATYPFVAAVATGTLLFAWIILTQLAGSLRKEKEI